MKLKSFLCLLLAFLLLTASAPFVLAESTDDGRVDYGEKSFRLLQGVGILPEHEPFRANRQVTRGEFLHYAIGLTGMSIESSLATMDSGFSDVPADHTYAKAIALAKNYGCISGNSSHTFNPDGLIKPLEAAKILCDILGYSQLAMGRGGYPAGYMMVSASLGLFDHVNESDEQILCVSDAMIMIANCAETEVMLLTSVDTESASFETRRGENLLSKRFEIKKANGVLSANAYTDLLATASEVGKKQVLVGDEIFNVGTTDVADYLGYHMTLYYRESDAVPEILYCEPSNLNVVTTADFDSLSLNGGYIKCERETGKIESLRIHENASYILNGKMSPLTQNHLVNFKKGFATFVDNGDDGTVDVVLVKSYQTYVVAGIDTLAETIIAEDGTLIQLDSSPNDYTCQIKKNGKSSSFSELAVGDVILLAASVGDGLNRKEILASDKTISATLSGKSDTTATVEGVEYSASTELLAGLAVGQRYKFLIDSFEEIIGTDAVQSAVYGYLYGLSSGMFGEVSCMIFSENNRWVELDFDETLSYNGINKTEQSVYSTLAPGGVAYKGLVRYRVNSTGEVNFLETPQDMSSYSLTSSEATTAAESNVFRKSYAGSLSWRTQSSSFDGKIRMNTSAVVFYVPEGATREDIKLVNVAALPANSSYSLVAYDVDKYLNAPVITISNIPNSIGSSSEFMIVKGVGRTLNLEEEVVPSLIGNWRNTEVALPVEISDALTLSQINALTKGTPILIKLDADGNLVRIQDCTPSSSGYYGSTTPYHTSYLIVGGKVLENDCVNGHLIVADSATTYFNSPYSTSTRVNLYDKVTDTYKVSSPYEILSGDVIVAKLSYFASQDIVVLRNFFES